MTQTGLLATKRLEGKTAVITIGNNSLDITMEQQLPINGRRHARMNLMQHSNRLVWFDPSINSNCFFAIVSS